MATLKITGDRLRELVHYNPESGCFTWAASGPRRVVGKECGNLNKDGYREIGLDYRRYLAHRLAFLYMTGEWPASVVDHANRDKLDNRWGNLRAASRSENAANSKLRANNTSGARGVTWDATKRRWHARICVDGKAIYLGRHKAIADAEQAVATAARKHWGDFAKWASNAG